MAYIKKLVINGFKSFGRKTEIIFDKGINTIVGPNGSGKSNVSDALCFVLGRLSAKSMRASQAKNMIFMGSKYVKPAKEASVDLFFDNSDQAFSIGKEEVILTRIVRRNGQSIYRINGETKTRTEIIEMLAQAGIDPHGFNLILQGQIQSIVKMHPEDRRKIVEEVAGISIYESRKEKSLHELGKTEEKLKEISTILRERSAYLRNLEKDRQQALRFKELELTVSRAKASIIKKKMEEREKGLKEIDKSLDENNKKKEKRRLEFTEIENEVSDIGDKIQRINKQIQHSTGLEQSTLRNNIANLKADIAGLTVKKETLEHRILETKRRISEMEKSIPDIEREIRGLREKSPLMAKKAEELKKKKEEIEKIEGERKKFIGLKTELNALKERLKDKERQLSRILAESESNLKNLEHYSFNLVHQDESSCKTELEKIKDKINHLRKEINDLSHRELENEKIVSVSEMLIERANDVKNKVNKLDVCPLCQSKITNEHISHVFKDSDERIKEANENLQKSRNELDKIGAQRSEAIENLKKLEDQRSKSEIELVRHRTVMEKKEHLKKLLSDEKNVKMEIDIFEGRIKSIEMKIVDFPKVEEKYDSLLLDIEEISSRSEDNVDQSLLLKEREIEESRNVIKRSVKDLEETQNEMNELGNKLQDRCDKLKEKEKQEDELTRRFKTMFDERDKMQHTLQEKSVSLSELTNEIRQIEDQINYLRVGKARLDAEKEALETEFAEHPGVELIQGSVNYLEERLRKSQEELKVIGSINMRSLEVYEEIKKEYDAVQEKVNILDREKHEILSIIEEIDKKKRNSFMKTFRAINELFTANFAQLYTKGIAYLEIENKEDIFNGGLNIVVKLAKGKYFDVSSLSGGEQTLVALSLLFAIQEHKPYHFYVFDEIDAALDKRNSERLSALLDKYMKAGQYIVITHNDAIIMNSNVLYGVSMHDGISKILSLKLQ